MTSKLYMTKKHFTPKKNNSSMTGEKINTIVERDIALTLLVMLLGLLLRNDNGFRGFPAGWLYTGSDPSLHSRPEYFFIALAASAAVAVICEISVSIMGRIAESSYSNGSGSQYTAEADSVYANSYDDSYVSDSNSKNVSTTKSLKSSLASKSEAKIPDLPLRRKENPIFKELNIKQAASSGGRAKSSAYSKSGSAASNAAMKFVLIIFSLIVISVIGVTVSLFTLDDPSDYEYNYEDDLSYDFYTEPEFMQDKCDEAFEMLSSGDEAALEGLGSGSPEGLLGMADWEYVSYNEENRSLTIGETDTAFIRFYAQTDDGREYMVAFKFEGGNLAYDESTAELTGIAACSYDVWNEYSPDNDWDRFTEEVNDRMENAGDVEYEGENILIW